MAAPRLATPAVRDAGPQARAALRTPKDPPPLRHPELRHLELRHPHSAAASLCRRRAAFRDELIFALWTVQARVKLQQMAKDAKAKKDGAAAAAGGDAAAEKEEESAPTVGKAVSKAASLAAARGNADPLPEEVAAAQALTDSEEAERQAQMAEQTAHDMQEVEAEAEREVEARAKAKVKARAAMANANAVAMEAAEKRKEARAAKAAVRESMNAAKAAREAAADAEALAEGRPKPMRAASAKEVAAGKPPLKAFQKTRDQEPGRARPPELRLKNRKRHGGE